MPPQCIGIPKEEEMLGRNCHHFAFGLEIVKIPDKNATTLHRSENGEKLQAAAATPLVKIPLHVLPPTVAPL